MTDRLREIEERAQKATEGPWTSPWEQTHEDPMNYAFRDSKGEAVVGIDWYDGPQFLCSEPNADFIAHAREDIPYLLAIIREQSLVIEGKNRALELINKESRDEFVVGRSRWGLDWEWVHREAIPNLIPQGGAGS